MERIFQSGRTEQILSAAHQPLIYLPEADVQSWGKALSKTRRIVARVAVVDKQGRLYLQHCYDKHLPEFKFWLLPGGGVKPTESLLNAACRELEEETGHKTLGSHLVWLPLLTLAAVEMSDLPFHYQGQFYFLYYWPKDSSISQFENINCQQFTVSEQDYILGSKWWNISELRSACMSKTETVFPNLLVHLLAYIHKEKILDSLQQRIPWTVEELFGKSCDYLPQSILFTRFLAELEKASPVVELQDLNNRGFYFTTWQNGKWLPKNLYF